VSNITNADKSDENSTAPRNYSSVVVEHHMGIVARSEKGETHNFPDLVRRLLQEVRSVTNDLFKDDE